MVSITHALRQVKEDLARVLSSTLIEGACREVGYVWRRRLLDPVTTIHLFVLQILHGNAACNHVPHLAEVNFSGAAWCQARARLPLAVVETLVQKATQVFGRLTESAGRWRGHRTCLVDGSSFSMADTPELQAHFGQPGGQRPGCGFPVAHSLGLFDAATGLILQARAYPLRTHDLSRAHEMHDALQKDDLLIADRGFCSFVHVALVLLRGCHALFRLHQRRPWRVLPSSTTKDGATVRGVRRLSRRDRIVEWLKPDKPPAWMAATDFDALPASIPLRQLHYQVRRSGFRTRAITVVTTLLDAERYPAEELADLYLQRWHIETCFRHLKQTLDMDILHCKSVEGVLKEMQVFLLVYNLVRTVMLEAAHRQGVPSERISFVDALRWLRHARPGQPLRRLIVNPLRPNRIEPRAVKRRPKQYWRLTMPRRLWHENWKPGKVVA